MTHWKSGMAPQLPLPWLVNTMAPKHLISWFPHPTSCSCCLLLTTVALQQASASDMKVRLLHWLIILFGRHSLICFHPLIHKNNGLLKVPCVQSSLKRCKLHRLTDSQTHILNLLTLWYLHLCDLIFRCENGVRLLSRSWYSSQWASPWQQFFYWLPCIIYVWPRIHTEWSGANCLRAESSVESRSSQLWWWDYFLSFILVLRWVLVVSWILCTLLQKDLTVRIMWSS